MTQSYDRTAWTDEDLTAFLDGESPEETSAAILQAVAEDPVLARRLDDLSPDLDVVRTGMESLLGSAPVLNAETPAPRGNFAMGWPAAAAAAVFALGIGLGTLYSDRSANADWHQAVADYQVLYTAETLTAAPIADDNRTAGLAHVSKRLGFELTEAELAVDGLTFQRAQILAHDGRPLAQLVYLDTNQNPIAFCIMRLGGQKTGFDETQIAGLNATTWSGGGLDFIVIGPADSAFIRQTAEKLGARMPG